MVSAEDVERSLRGSAALLGRRVEGLREFEFSEAAFWRSFAALLLTAPAAIVALGLLRRELGLGYHGSELFGDPGLVLLVVLGQVVSFLSLPLVMIGLCRRLGLSASYVPFTIVTNWISAYAALGLAVPGALMLVGLETPEHATLFWAGFLVVALHLHWFAAKAALGVGGWLAAGIAGLDLALDRLVATLVGWIA